MISRQKTTKHKKWEEPSRLYNLVFHGLIYISFPSLLFFTLLPIYNLIYKQTSFFERRKNPSECFYYVFFFLKFHLVSALLFQCACVCLYVCACKFIIIFPMSPCLFNLVSIPIGGKFVHQKRFYLLIDIFIALIFYFIWSLEYFNHYTCSIRWIKCAFLQITRKKERKN